VQTDQCGVVTRKQALAGGLSPGTIRGHVESGRWQRLLPGVYATFTGPVPRICRLWAAVLAAGPEALLSHQTAAELQGLIDEPVELIHVTIPARRRLRALPGIVSHTSHRAERAAHPSRLPPQTRIEETVVDLTQVARSVDQALGWVVRAVARRLTTVDRLRTAFASRPKLRWRGPLLATLDDVGVGCHSTLELTYVRDVERRHGLPTAARQTTRVRRGGRWYNDVEYTDFSTIVELDGPPAHPDEARARDMRRDNAAVASGKTMLRYGPVHIRGEPCTTAAEVATVLQRNGWRGRPRPCGPRCVIAEAITPDSARDRPRSRSA
jgi:hypothetical protein